MTWAAFPLLSYTVQYPFGRESLPTIAAAAAGVAEGPLASPGAGARETPRTFGTTKAPCSPDIQVQPSQDLELTYSCGDSNAALSRPTAIATPNRTFRRILTRNSKSFSRFHFILSRSRCP